MGLDRLDAARHCIITGHSAGTRDQLRLALVEQGPVLGRVRCVSVRNGYRRERGTDGKRILSDGSDGVGDGHGFERSVVERTFSDRRDGFGDVHGFNLGT